MQRLRIRHLTEYIFPVQVMLNQHFLLLRPREGHDLRIESSLLTITPAYTINWHRDAYDNSRAMLTFLELADRLTIASEVVIQHYEESPFDFFLEEYAIHYPFSYTEDERPDLFPFQQTGFPNDQQTVNRWIHQLGLWTGSTETISMLVTLNQIIKNQFRYLVRDAPGVQSPVQTLEQGSGSCRDYATLFMESCRCLGLASRFVSGYLHTPETETGNATTHAWAEVYLPGTGWKGFDPTIGQVTGIHHIAVAVTRNPEAVPPVAGSFVGPPFVIPVLTVNVQVNHLSDTGFSDPASR